MPNNLNVLSDLEEHLDHFDIQVLLITLKTKVMLSSLTHEAKLKTVQDLQNAELKILADLNPAREQVNIKQ